MTVRQFENVELVITQEYEGCVTIAFNGEVAGHFAGSITNERWINWPTLETNGRVLISRLHVLGTKARKIDGLKLSRPAQHFPRPDSEYIKPVFRIRIERWYSGLLSPIGIDVPPKFKKVKPGYFLEVLLTDFQ